MLEQQWRVTSPDSRSAKDPKRPAEIYSGETTDRVRPCSKLPPPTEVHVVDSERSPRPRYSLSPEGTTLTQSLVREKARQMQVCQPHLAPAIADGTALQRDVQTEAVWGYHDLIRQHSDAVLIGSSNHTVVPGLFNDHFHAALVPLRMVTPDPPLELWGLACIGTRLIDPDLDQMYGAVQTIETSTRGKRCKRSWKASQEGTVCGVWFSRSGNEGSSPWGLPGQLYGITWFDEAGGSLRSDSIRAFLTQPT